MNAQSEARQRLDRNVVYGLLAVAYLICIAGFVMEYGVIEFLIRAIGMMGLFAILLSFVWGIFLLACYLEAKWNP